MSRREVEPLTISKSTQELYHNRFDIIAGRLWRKPESSMQAAEFIRKKVDPTGEKTVTLFAEHYLTEEK